MATTPNIGTPSKGIFNNQKENILQPTGKRQRADSLNSHHNDIFSSNSKNLPSEPSSPTKLDLLLQLKEALSVIKGKDEGKNTWHLVIPLK